MIIGILNQKNKDIIFKLNFNINVIEKPYFDLKKCNYGYKYV